MPKISELSIIMPVYNEVNTVLEMLRLIQQEKHRKEIIIVDDASTDGTKELLEKIKEENVKVFYNLKNQGKGYCIRRAIPEVSKDIVIIQDADLEYYPDEYSILIKKIIEGKADVVYGSRFLGGPHRVLFFWHYVGNKFLTLLADVFSNLNISDMETGYKVFKKEVLNEIKLRSNRFGFEPEFTMKVAKKGFRVYEVPISYSGRTYEEGKKIDWKDGLKAIFAILWFRFFD